VCLELRRFDESVAVAEAAVALDPSDVELLGNLSLSYLLAGRLEHARKAVDTALKIDPEDSINQIISRILSEIAEGRREQPKSLADCSKPAKPKKKRFLKLPWK
jgi:tetratricopeptide (TPR) repeat protein